jgi:5-methylcytosine-specific restriction endonuclease McrA
MKQCSRCKKTKPNKAFGRNRTKADGLQSECKLCKRSTDKVSDRKHRARKNITDRRNKHIRRAYIRTKQAYTIIEWQALKEKYNHTCLRCGKAEPEIKLTVDHILPISKDGNNTIDNIQPLCSSCNSSKGATFIDYRKQYVKDR